HYLWPLLPFMLFFLLKGSPRWAISVLGVLYFWQGAFALSTTFRKQPEQQLPRETLAWISEHTPPHSCFLTPNGAVVSLYTGRPAYSLIKAHDAHDFHDQLAKLGVEYVLITP